MADQTNLWAKEKSYELIIPKIVVDIKRDKNKFVKIFFKCASFLKIFKNEIKKLMNIMIKYFGIAKTKKR